MKKPFSATIMFSDFIRHYRKLDDRTIAEDVKRSMDDLEEENDAGSSFGSFMVQKAKERIAANREKSASFGKLGGRPKKDSNGDPRPGESANLSNAPKSHTAAVPGDQAEGAKSLPANGRGKIPGIGEFKNVKITPEERQKLEARFGDVSGLIEELSDYLKNHPKKYSDHYAALRSWARRRVADGKSINSGKKMTQGEELADYYARREWEILNGNG